MGDRFDQAEYQQFLRAKAVPEFSIVLDESGMAQGVSVPARFAHMLGAESAAVAPLETPLATFLFPDQRAIVQMALEAERFACWSDCGLGKTLIELEFARQVVARTLGRVLIITLPEVVGQIAAMAREFYGDGLPVQVLTTRAEMRAWCADSDVSGVAVTNYEKMNPDGGPETQVVREMSLLAGVVLDESSRLKTGGGKQKWALIKSAKGVRYKISCTATPAPNEVMEFASQAAFLERIRGESEVMWTYFTRDPVTNEWTVKKHARPHFFRWMVSWSIYLRRPEAYGWKRDVPEVPEPEFIEHRIRATQEQREMAFAAEAAESSRVSGHADLFAPRSLGMVGRNVLSQVAKGFRYEKKKVRRIPSNKPPAVAELVEEDVAAGLQVLVWCIFDAEVDIIAEELKKRKIGFASLGGSNSKADRLAVLERFRAGTLPVLVSKASMLGFGMNFQHCGSMVFSGFTDSFESFYQAVRRAYRFGQKRRLRVHLPFVPELEEAILRNVLRKAAQFEELIAEQERAYIAALGELKEAA